MARLAPRFYCLISSLLLLSAQALALTPAEQCTQTLSPAIKRSCIVKPAILWRGAKPDAAGAATLVEMGVASVVNLELLNDDLPSFLAASPKLEQARSVNYFRIREWEPNVVVAPAKLEKNIAQFIAIMRSQAKPVYVHCRSGQNRTGIMVAAYRLLEEGVPVEQVISEMGSFNGIWFKQNARFLRELASKPHDYIEQLIAKESANISLIRQIHCQSGSCKAESN